LANGEQPPLMLYLVWSEYTRLAKQIAAAAIFGSSISRSTKLVALPVDLVSRFDAAQDPDDLLVLERSDRGSILADMLQILGGDLGRSTPGKLDDGAAKSLVQILQQLTLVLASVRVSRSPTPPTVGGATAPNSCRGARRSKPF
jgi:hypothetical protein